MPPRRRPRRAAFRESYDALAAEYTKRIYDELKDKPFDREFLDRFAGRVRNDGWVCDLGCGPAHVARYLQDRGVTVFGLDLSLGMLAEAARLNPGMTLVQGSMFSMGLRSESLAGLAAFYSVIHAERDQVRAVLAEMWRVLRRGACLLLAFHLGTDVLHSEELWGVPVSLDVTFFTIPEMTDYVKRAGFRVEDARERDPYPEVEYQSRRGYILAVKP